MIGLFSKSVYPAKGGSAIVTEELARCFSRDEMVVVGGRGVFERPFERAHSRVEVYTLRSELNIKGRGDRFFEALRWMLFPFLLIQAIRICRKHQCTSIVASFPDDLFLYLGLKVAERLQIPLFAYFHNTLLENRSGWRAVIASHIQGKVFSKAKRVLVISDGLARYYRKEYPQVDFRTVQHAFWGNVAPYSEVANSRRNEVKTVILCGNINETNIDATRRVIDALYGWQGFRVTLYTPVPAILLRVRGIDIKKVNEITYVPDEDFMKKLGEADLLVLTLGLEGGLSDVEYRTIFPTRTVPILLSGCPMLVHAPKSSFLAEFVREWRCGVVVDEPDEDALRRAAHELTSNVDLMRSVTSQAAQAAALFHGSVVRALFLTEIGYVGAT